MAANGGAATRNNADQAALRRLFEVHDVDEKIEIVEDMLPGMENDCVPR